MIWLFLILAFSTVAVTWAGIALYLRVRRHMLAGKDGHGDLEHPPETGKL